MRTRQRGHQKEITLPSLNVSKCALTFQMISCGSSCVHQRPDEEVVVDQGGTSSVLNIHYEKEELEGKQRAQEKNTSFAPH